MSRMTEVPAQPCSDNGGWGLSRLLLPKRTPSSARFAFLFESRAALWLLYVCGILNCEESAYPNSFTRNILEQLCKAICLFLFTRLLACNHGARIWYCTTGPGATHVCQSCNLDGGSAGSRLAAYVRGVDRPKTGIRRRGYGEGDTANPSLVTTILSQSYPQCSGGANP